MMECPWLWWWGSSSVGPLSAVVTLVFKPSAASRDTTFMCIFIVKLPFSLSYVSITGILVFAGADTFAVSFDPAPVTLFFLLAFYLVVEDLRPSFKSVLGAVVCRLSVEIYYLTVTSLIWVSTESSLLLAWAGNSVELLLYPTYAV